MPQTCTGTGFGKLKRSRWHKTSSMLFLFCFQGPGQQPCSKVPSSVTRAELLELDLSGMVSRVQRSNGAHHRFYARLQRLPSVLSSLHDPQEPAFTGKSDLSLPLSEAIRMGCRIFSFVPASTAQGALSMHFLRTSVALHSVLSHVRVSRIQAKALLECGAWVTSGLADSPRDLDSDCMQYDLSSIALRF